MPWDTAQKALQAEDIPRSRGWDLTIAKLSKFDWNDEYLDVLRRIYLDSVFCGEKSVSFYHLSDSEISELRTLADEAQPTESILADCFPLPLNDKILGTQIPQKQKLISVERTDEAIALVYSGIFSIEVRHHYTEEDIPTELEEFFSDCKEVIGVKEVKMQSFDILWIPHHSNVVSLRVDSPRGVQKDTILRMQANLQDIIEKSFDNIIKDKQINLFPLIDAIYSDKTKGNVVELAFSTKTASLKHERMRRTGTCLRKEIYHKAGLAALNGKIDPYRISVEWPRVIGPDLESVSELSLIGRSRMTLDETPFLGHAILRRCTDVSDFENVVSTVLKMLQDI